MSYSDFDVDYSFHESRNPSLPCPDTNILQLFVIVCSVLSVETSRDQVDTPPIPGLGAPLPSSAAAAAAERPVTSPPTCLPVYLPTCLPGVPGGPTVAAAI